MREARGRTCFEKSLIFFPVRASRDALVAERRVMFASIRPHVSLVIAFGQSHHHRVTVRVGHRSQRSSHPSTEFENSFAVTRSSSRVSLADLSSRVVTPAARRHATTRRTRVYISYY